MPTPEGAESASLPPELNDRALKALKAPELFEPALPSGFATLARLWHYEAEGLWRAWSVSSRPSAIDAHALRIRKVVWDRTAEYARFKEPPPPDADALTPRITLAEARFPLESWNALVEEAGALRVQPLPPDVSSAGGARDRFGIAYRVAAQTVSFEWWDTPPEGWRELAEWTARMRDALEAWLPR
jgi:hypothetical protein